MLVCAWNAANPDRPINLSYIAHAEMVAKIAQGIATGDVPDLMGMDLIYAPQFENAGQLVDVTDKIADWPSSPPRAPATCGRDLQRPPLRRAAVRRRVGAVLQQGPVQGRRARPGEAADEPRRAARLRGQDHRARRRHQGYYLPGNCAGCNIFTVGPLMWASGAQDRGRQVRRRAARRRRRQAGPPVAARHGQGRQRPGQRPGRERRHVRRAVRHGQDRHHGHRQLQHHAGPRPDERTTRHFDFGISLLPGLEPGTSPRSSVATSWSSRRAASASTTPSTS